MKLIPLSVRKKGRHANKYFAQVDDNDYDYLMQWNWSPNISGKIIYAQRSIKINDKWSSTSMHRVIMDVHDSKILIDHKDRNGLNNQRCNIRLCSQSENQQNTVSRLGGTSKYKGVSFSKGTTTQLNKNGIICTYFSHSWIARIRINGKTKHLGCFKTEEDAAIAYDNAAKIYHKHFAVSNLR